MLLKKTQLLTIDLIHGVPNVEIALFITKRKHSNYDV